VPQAVIVVVIVVVVPVMASPVVWVTVLLLKIGAR
jgi:hypothetical protein